MLNCREVTRVCSDQLDRPLRLGERASLRLHLVMCAGCTNYRRQLKVLRQAMHAYADGKAAASVAENAGRQDSPSGSG